MHGLTFDGSTTLTRQTTQYALQRPRPRVVSARKLTRTQDSDTNPNTRGNSVAGDPAPADGRKRRAEEMNMRKSMYGKKAEGLRASMVRDLARRIAI